MKPEPLWRRIARRPWSQRGDPPRWSDYDPLMAPIHIAVNRNLQAQQRMLDRLDRLEERAARRRPTGQP